jgi:hypothetical protein
MMGVKHLIIEWVMQLIVAWTEAPCKFFRTLYITIIQVSNYISRPWSSHPTCLQTISARLLFTLMRELTADVIISQLQLQQLKLQSFFHVMGINLKTPMTLFFTAGMAHLFSTSMKCIQCTFLSTMSYSFQLASWDGTRECFVLMHPMHLNLRMRMKIPWTMLRRQLPRSNDT